jgi:hypothetical protein
MLVIAKHVNNVYKKLSYLAHVVKRSKYGHDSRLIKRRMALTKFAMHAATHKTKLKIV